MRGSIITVQQVPSCELRKSLRGDMMGVMGVMGGETKIVQVYFSYVLFGVGKLVLGRAVEIKPLSCIVAVIVRNFHYMRCPLFQVVGIGGRLARGLGHPIRAIIEKWIFSPDKGRYLCLTMSATSYIQSRVLWDI